MFERVPTSVSGGLFWELLSSGPVVYIKYDDEIRNKFDIVFYP